MHKYCRLALDSIEYYLQHNDYLETPKGLPDGAYKKRAGVFTSLHLKNDHSLRGCIGTFAPTKENIAEEIIYNAVMAALEDPRFAPVALGELKNLEVSVDVLQAPEDCKKEDLDPRKYGVIVTKDKRKGLLLPDLPGVDDVEQQITIAAGKGGIDYPREDFKIQRFMVERYI